VYKIAHMSVKSLFVHRPRQRCVVRSHLKSFQNWTIDNEFYLNSASRFLNARTEDLIILSKGDSSLKLSFAEPFCTLCILKTKQINNRKNLKLLVFSQEYIYFC